MPEIRPSSDLRNSYIQISEYCHKYSEPVFITKNGKGDLAVMSMETYEALVGRFELTTLLEAGLTAAQNGEETDARAALEKLRRRYDEKV